MTNSKNNEFDIFIANSIYPDAESLLTAHLKSLEEIKDDCCVVLDTNVLLVPYGTGKGSLDQIRQTYAALIAQNRLVVPGQVAREFAKNRANKLAELYQQLNRKRSIPSLQQGRYPLLEPLAEYQQVIELEKRIDDSLREYRDAIGRLLAHVRGWNWNDPVSMMYADLFCGKVVLDPPLSHEEIEKDLARRQLHSIPPGYKDSDKPDKGIGDLLIWNTILKVGETRKKSVIFVSGEEKPDWWHSSERQPLYPRYELVDEFRRHSEGRSFHIVELSRLLELYGASKQVVEEVQRGEQRLDAEQALQTMREYQKSLAEQTAQATKAVGIWLMRKYPHSIVQENRRGPDFTVVNSDGTKMGVEVKFHLKGGRVSLDRIRSAELGGENELIRGHCDDFALILVSGDDDEETILSWAGALERLSVQFPKHLHIVGYLASNGEFRESFSFRAQDK